MLKIPEDLPETFGFAKPLIRKVHDICHEIGLTPREMAIGYIKNYIPEANVIFGAKNPIQVKENAATWLKDIPVPDRSELEAFFHPVSDQILNPRLWPN